ncbi:MAG: dtpA 1 [Gammaproteobacteria bacterium]|jgi:POT family proton-dependent oligopeptide transporter|nr:dtpA 1 [Gammaproteobacteria bacterium]
MSANIIKADPNQDLISPHSHAQPKVLVGICLVEIWERFAYWALFSLIVLFTTQQLNLSDAKSYLIFAAYNALLYTTPLLGGWIADKYLTAEKAVLHGVLILSAGYLCLAFWQSESSLYISLGLVIWGMGLFKPNITAVLGACYDKEDKRREKGFTLYYMSINVGASLGMLLCGIVAKYFGWQAAFSVIAAAMLLGALIYGCKLSSIQKSMQGLRKLVSLKTHLLITLIGVWLVVVLSILMSEPKVAHSVLLSAIFILVLYLISIIRKQPQQARNRLIAALILTATSIVFWALFLQIGSTLTLYIQRCVNLDYYGYAIPVSAVSSTVGILLLFLTPVMLGLWSGLDKLKKEPSTATKFMLGILLIALAYGLLAISAIQLDPGEKLNLLWILAAYTLQTLGELSLSPIGLAMIIALIGESYRGLMFGVWFLAMAIGSELSGVLASFAAVPAQAVQDAHISSIYAHAFGLDALIAFVVTGIVMIFIPYIKKLMR